MRRLSWSLLLSGLLAGCGGDGGSSGGSAGTSAPLPTQTSAPAATPTPTAAASSTYEVKPTADATYLAASMDLQTIGNIAQTTGVITGGMTSSRNTILDTPQFSASYSAAAGYSLSDGINTALFTPGQLTSNTTKPSGSGTAVYTANSGAIEDYLALYQCSSSSSGDSYKVFANQYGGATGWQHTYLNGSVRQTRLDYVAYGAATPPAAMPQSGVKRFTVCGSGNYATNTDLWFFKTDGSTLSVDFAAGTVSGIINLIGSNFYKDVFGGLGFLRVSGSFAKGNSVTASIGQASLGTAFNVPGSFHLLFVGPSANELIITYVAQDGTQTMVGSSVGIVDLGNQ